MPQETLGFVKLEWTCPKCGSRNPGPEKTCLSCGAPQPQDVQFAQAAGQVISQDENLKKIAEKGPDIHCPFCGTRNPAEATICSQCGGDLKTGLRRETGKVVGAFQAGPVKQIACPNCGQLNLETSLKCSNCGAALATQPAIEQPVVLPTSPVVRKQNIWVIIAAGVLLLVCLIAAGTLLAGSYGTREKVTGTVSSVEWQTSVAIEALGPVQHADWEADIPQQAQVGDCNDRIYSVTDSEPAGESYNKVCGTPYTIDTGSGVGRVVQDCQYEIIRPYCEYSLQEWQVIDQKQLNGTNLEPIYASPVLASDQQLGGKSGTYSVILDTATVQYTYHPESLEEFRLFQIGSTWVVNLNAFGQIVSVEPAQ